MADEGGTCVVCMRQVGPEGWMAHADDRYTVVRRFQHDAYLTKRSTEGFAPAHRHLQLAAIRRREAQFDRAGAT